MTEWEREREKTDSTFCYGKSSSVWTWSKLIWACSENCMSKIVKSLGPKITGNWMQSKLSSVKLPNYFSCFNLMVAQIGSKQTSNRDIQVQDETELEIEKRQSDCNGDI